MTSSNITLISEFSKINDPRLDRQKLHKLIDIFAITVCAVICGASTWNEIAQYGQSKQDWLKTFLELPNGIPSHDTIRRIFIIIDPEEFRTAFIDWVDSIRPLLPETVIAVDGKTLRRSYDKTNGKSAIHVVSAWASDANMVLGQIKTDEKSNEITAIPQLLDLLDILGSTVTIDAMGCQKKIAEKIIDNGADYALALKKNHGDLYDDVELFFHSVKKAKPKEIPRSYFDSAEGDHGRVEIRRHWVISDIDWIADKPLWKGLQGIGMVERERHIKDHISCETSYYLLSQKLDAEEFAKKVRAHWGIENKLHWVLDVSFREDECRKRAGNAAENFAMVRHVATNLLKQENSMSKSMNVKRLQAGWDNSYLMKVLRVNTI
nr:ISAs1 family transposase [uncultured Desulfobacter sp.]